MHLKTIKLAGFKSFVEPTTLQLRSELTAVVGPNGCGKSNIVDAVRWVIGESSAKYLRAQDMSEVIFNGTASRKPLAQASVELIFDNSDESLGGQYASYAEISVRRSVDREGLSQYFLNNHRCRRRDITDIFLGTGLGPRSYAIIEQGMVTRLIDAKPEELANYLKEVAGISKYEERRKETQQHIRATRDNLDKVSGICSEIAKQLQKLTTQAKAAEQFRLLKDQEKILKTELKAMRFQSFYLESKEHNLALTKHQDLLTQKLAIQTNLSTHIQTLRNTQNQHQSQLNLLQNNNHQRISDIKNLEQQIQYNSERSVKAASDLAKLGQHIQALESHLAEDRTKQTSLNVSMPSLNQNIEQAKTHAATTLTQLKSFEEKISGDQTQWEAFVSLEAQTLKQFELNKHRIDSIKHRIATEKQRQERLHSELSNISIQASEQNLHTLTKEYAELDAAHKTSQQTSAALKQQIEENRQAITLHTRELAKHQTERQHLQGRLSALETMQQAAMNQEDEKKTSLLKDRGLHQYPRLAQKITVDIGWELAVETALQRCLAAICLPDLHKSAQTLSDSILAAFNTTSHLETSLTDHPKLGTPLLAKIKAPWSLAGLLSGIYIADTLENALARIPFLQHHESIITQEGIHLGQAWLTTPGKKEQMGVLVRQQAIEELHGNLIHLQEKITELEQTLADHQTKLREHEQVYQSAQKAQNTLLSQCCEKQSELSIQTAELTHLQKRQTLLQQELDEIAAHLLNDEKQLTSALADLENAQQKMQENTKNRMHWVQKRNENQIQLTNLQAKANTAQQGLQAQTKHLESLLQQTQFLAEQITRADKQLQDLMAQRKEIQAQQNDNTDPLDNLKKNLASLLQERDILQKSLEDASAGLHLLTKQLEQALNQEQANNQEIHQLRTLLEPLQRQHQEAIIRATALKEELLETGDDLQAILNTLSPTANANLWQAHLETNLKKIEKLGPINLAALNEHKELSTRKQEIDAQQQDLIEALTTLEDAIIKIDEETHALFKDTFDKVNQAFQTLFPKIFNGGTGQLFMTNSTDTTGITVMVHPPGKRNTPIQALSGGEKALTAIALIFALFQLNPAPFCILDEVDAPLDDQNVGRFCALIKEISEQIQFIMITHNKLAMEIAHQLLGITMQESGVSRIVAVDMQDAMDLVQ